MKQIVITMVLLVIVVVVGFEIYLRIHKMPVPQRPASESFTAVFRCDSDFGSRLETRVCNGKGLVRNDLPDVPGLYTIDDYKLKKFLEIDSENNTFTAMPLEASNEILDESAIQNSKGLVFFLGDERIQGHISHHYFCISSDGRFNFWYSPETNCSTRYEKRSWAYWNGPSCTIYLIKYDGKKVNEKLFDLKGYRRIQ